MPTAPEARIIDEAKRYKSTLVRAICYPFWDDVPQQDPSAHYLANETDVSGSSVAGATARAVCLLSFVRSLYEKHPVVVTKDEVVISVGNIWKGNQLYSILFERGNCLSRSVSRLVAVEGNLISALLMTLMDFPLLTMRTKTSLLIHSANLKNWIGMPLQRTKGWIINRIIKVRKTSVIFQMSNGRKALRSSGSLSGTGVLVMCIMVFFMC